MYFYQRDLFTLFSIQWDLVNSDLLKPDNPDFQIVLVDRGYNFDLSINS